MDKPSPLQSVSLVGFFIALAGALLFSTKAVIVKVAFVRVSVDALTLLTLRMVFSLPFYLVTAFIEGGKKSTEKMTRKQWLATIALGLFGYYLSSLFDFIGLQYISAGLERLILFLYPTFAVLINAFVFRQKIYRNQLAALLLTYLGIAIAFFGELQLDVGKENFYWGSFLIFLCAITFSIFIVGSGRMIPQVGATRFTAYSMLASTAGVFVHFAFAGNYEVLQQRFDLWGYGLLLAVAATVIPSFLVSSALKKIGSNNVAVISSIGPVSTIVQAHFFLAEPIFAQQLAGTVLVLTGILILSWKSGK